MSGTTYTPSLRLAIMTPGDPAVRNQWGTIWDATFQAVESAVTGNSAISIDGLTSYSLTANNNAPDQSRRAVYNFTGTLVSACTVAIPAVPKAGWVQNNTTGGQNVLLTTGSGNVLTIVPGLSYWFTCDGTNVDTINLGVAGLETIGDLIVGGALIVTGGLTFSGLLTTKDGIANTGTISSTGALSVASGGATIGGGLTVTGGTTSDTMNITGAGTIVTAGTTGNQVVNFSQFNPTTGANGFIKLPGGVTEQWGNATTAAGGTKAVTFPTAFSNTPWAITVSAVNSVSATISSVASAPAADKNGFTAQCNLVSGVGTASVFYWRAIGPT